MNKNRHRIIFNGARGHRMVVAETAGSHGGAAVGEAAPGSTRSPMADAAIKRSLTALAVLLLCTPAHPQIVADPSAPGNQRPTILQTANGLPQVNIQTPSAAGVSRNTYSRFDVQSNGAILNNSRTNTTTQLGGLVAANPWLATGEARVILNEVHSSHPSHLNGYVEVAGRRAEVIIANPAGIQVNGGGFINASGVTLTTGTPVMNSGHLDAFRVQGGSVHIEGLGLDTSTADHTAILTRAMQVNAGVWAKDLTVVTGSNEVKALASGASALSARIAGSGAAPTFMLDVGALGGMYAGKIHLVGTEAGLGVNNRGSLIAHEGTWVLQTDGSLVNTGEVHAKGDLSIQTAGSVSNTGVNASISSQAHTTLSAGGEVDNTDGEIASAGMLSVATQGPLTNLRGRLLAVGDSTIDTQGALLDNTAGRINAQATLSLNTGELLNGAQATQAGLIGSNGDLSIYAGVATNGANGATRSNIWSAQTARLSTQSFTNAGVLSGRHVALDATADATNAAGASITATDSIAIDAVTFNNRGSVYANETADPATPSLVHIQATTLNNTGAGAIFGDQIAMAATTLNNRPEAGGTTTPVIAARQQLDMGVQTLNNEDGALIYSGGNMAIAGSLDATLSATGQAQTIHNLSAQIETVGNLRVAANSLTNQRRNVAVSQVVVSEQTAVLGMPSWWVNGHNRFFDTPIETTSNYTPHQFYLVNPANILSDTQLVTPDGNIVRRVEVQLDPADSVYHAAAGGYAGNYGVRERITVGSAATVVLYARVRQDGVVNPDQVASAADPTASYTASVFAWQRDALSFSTAYGRCTTHCTMLVVEPGYSDPQSTIVRATHRNLNGTHAGIELTRTARQSVVEDRLNTDAGAPASIRSGANMRLDITNALTNRNADIQTGVVLDVQAAGAAVVNEGQTLKRTHSFLNTTHTWQMGSFDWTNPDINEVIGLVGGTLSGAQQLSITAQSLSNTDLARTTAQPTGGLGFLGTTGPITVPNSAMFQPANAGSRYLIESDPRFTDYRQWLGSDYMFAALGSDPNALQKRLGDGFYEQRLVREQVGQLTGRRFLEGHASDEAQFQALMDAGITYAQARQLVPGVALSAEQMAQLTTDLVWLVEREVVLPDGSKTTALMPQVYLRQVPQGDFAAGGALLAGNSVSLQIAEDLVNAGGRIEGGVVVAQAGRDLSNIGGLMQARSELLASAGRNVTISSPTHTTSFNGQYVKQSRTELAGVGAMKVGNTAGAKLSIEAGGNVALLGASVSNAGAGGSTAIKAGGDVQLQTVTVGSSDNTEYNARNYQRRSNSTELGTGVQGAGSISIQAGNDVTARAASVNAGDDLSVKAGNSIKVEAGRAVSESESSLYVQRRGLLSKKSTEELRSSASDVALGTSLGGKNVSMQAGQDIALRGSSVVADNNTTLGAGRDVLIEAEESQFSSSEFRETRKSGLFASGAGITLGKQQRSRGQQLEQTTAAGSTVGAIGGDVTVKAGQTYTQVGSDVMTPGGNIDISARAVEISEARESSTSQVEQKFKQSGLSVSVGSGVIAAAQGVVNTAKAVGDTKNDRMQALGAATLALQGKDLAEQAQKLGQLSDASSLKHVGKATGVSLSISLGSSKSQSTESSQSDTARGSTVVAGGDINVRAGGAGDQSDITVRGSQVQAGDTTTLKAEGDVSLLAAQNTTQERSQQSSSSGSIGASVGVSSAGVGVSVNASASKGRGQGAGDGTSYTNTQLGGQTVQVESGGDTTLRGAVVSGERVTAKVGGDLKIESLQDTATYDERSKSSGFSVSVPVYGTGQAGANVSAGKTKIESDFNSVAEQSAIRAGDGGFQVSVAGDTALVGGQITSTDKAVKTGANRFETDGKLTLSDINNQAQYQADASGVTIGVGSHLASSGMGLGSDDGAASSTTLAAISGVAGNTAARTGDAQTGIGQIFDKDRVKDEVGAQVVIMKAFTQQAVPAGARYADGKAVDLRRVGNEEEARKWDEGGEYRVALHAGIGLLTGGTAGAVGAATGAALIPVLGEQIAHLNLSEPVRQGVTQVVGAVLGAAAGGTAGAATSLNQTAHNYVTHSPYASVRRTVSQENARLTQACGTTCTAEDFRRIDQQMARLEAAGNLAAIARHSGLTPVQGQQMAQLALELAPVYGTGEALVQLLTGQSSVSGEQASRFWAAVGVVPVAGGVLRRAGEPAVDALVAIFKGAEAGKAAPRAPVDIAHTIGADINARTGKVTGGHTLINGDVRVTEVVTPPDANGVYEAVVEIKTPDGKWQIKTVGATEKPLKNTMFPKDWDAQKVQAEIDSAWASQRPHPEDKNKWIGTSSSGIEIEGYKQPRTTAYPLYGRGKKP